MGLLRLVFIGIATIIALAEAAEIDYYASKYDHIDIDGILNNRRMVNYYAACMLSKGPCPPEGLEFKRIFPEALRTNCLKCTEKQKTVILRTIRRLKKEHPKVWAQMEAQWDPDGTYERKFEASFGARETEEVSLSIQVLNRFGDNKGVENSINQIFPTSSSTPKVTSTSTTKPSSTISTSSTTHRIIATTTTNKPNINTITGTSKPTKRPRPNLEASIQATVSLGPKLVGEFVRELGALGTRVVETGAEIAGVVLKNIARPL